MKIKPIMDYLDEVVEKELVPGVCYGFVSLSEKQFYHCGYKQLIPTKELNSIDTIYDMASCTKVIATTTAILLLLEQGKFSLKTKISSILPRYKHKNITVKDLLTHTSGMPGENKDYKKCDSKESFIDYIYNLDLAYETGTKVLYTDYNFIILGFVIEAITNMSIGHFTAENIFKPLEMKNSGFLSSHVDPSLCASMEVTSLRGVIRGVVHDGKALKLNGLSGNAGLFSTVGDLSNFVTMVLNKGTFNGKQFLHPETIQLFHHCYTKGLNLRRTLGWINNEPSSFIGDYYSDQMIFHTGFSGTSIYIDFTRECGIILLANRIHPSRENENINEIRDIVTNLTLLNL